MNYKKINPRRARRLFYRGRTIYLHPSNMSWNNMWQNPMPFKWDPEDEKIRREFHERSPNDFWTKQPKRYISCFDAIYNSFSYYNCNEERGKKVICLIEI